MRRIVLLSLIVYGLVLAGLAGRDGALLALALPFAVYLAAELLNGPEVIELQISRTQSTERTGAGLPVDVSVVVTNTGPSLDNVLIEDNVPPGLTVIDGSARHLLALPRGKSVTWTYTLHGGRGYYRFTSFTAQARGPLGLASREQVVPAAAQLFVLPPLLRLKYVAIRPRRTRVYSGLVPAHMGGPGAEFFGIREYQAGDPQRWLNWHATARHPSTLFSNEFEQERVTDIGIVLDSRERANARIAGSSIFEYSALAAAAMADAFLAQGNRVGLLVYGQFLHWTLPGYGKIQRERILRVLAQAQPGGSEAFADLAHIPTRLFPAHSQLVIITPLLPDDLDILLRLRARGYQVLVVSPNPIAFEVALLRRRPDVELAARILRMERTLLLQRARRAGIQMVDWDVSMPFEQMMASRLSRPTTWLRAVSTASRGQP